MRVLTAIIAVPVFLCLSAAAFAQNANIDFGAAALDQSQPLEITADQLTVDQTAGSAVFEGNVVAGQGEMRLSAGRVQVEYATENGTPTGEIERLLASGGVTLVNGAEQAEARDAVYAVGSSEIIMSGDVILTQGQNALSGEKLIVDLTSGQARMVGRVRTIFQTGGNP